MSAKQAKRERQATGVVKEPKVGTPLMDRTIPAVVKQGPMGPYMGPSQRYMRKVADRIKVTAPDHQEDAGMTEVVKKTARAKKA